jgi:hypothetical protein
MDTFFLSQHGFRYLLVGEDISSNQMDLGVTVLTSLTGGHFNNLTGTIYKKKHSISFNDISICFFFSLLLTDP